ncbi:right-handed parallel beta-helix repeat-containing protein [Noviherbaspirillum aridicola]|uniref:Right handed beta helix domain-containing protein n=1 Tax=Noviherbaspirillum aridicola TaxID=2849687 RepID=A0ABQ4PZS6_9BURK|nr:right-handed parallel beta-helix repeat-containing protein [Noviherbaspirillum aridicola]GIZ50403.1 hypothetical protein NCCP691_04170 [Noviherbaspirillum aridicola]
MKHAKQPILLTALLVGGAITGLAACGGGGGGGGSASEASASTAVGNSASTTSNAPAASETPYAAPPAQPSLALPVLSLPAAPASGAVLALECGRTYRGTLDLRGKANVTVRTAGDCGKATISPGREITGWTRHQGNIWSAPVDFAAAQLSVGGQPQRLAHWPSRAQGWARAESSSAGSLRYAMPSSDLVGARLLFRPYEWAMEARTITGYANGTMALASTGDANYDGYALEGQPDFYVEGKLWMLDEAGEWAQSGDRLYVWTADGQSPEGRAWASPDAHGINAANSSSVRIEGVSIFGATDGIHARDAGGLQVRDVDIANSAGNGIMNSGGSGLRVEGGSIRNSRHDAIAVKWGGGGEHISRVRIDAAGSLGMPVNAHAAINLTAGNGATVSGNTVTNAGYIGIRTFRDSVVTGNVVDGACLMLTDCGGIFNSARDGLPLNARIENNTIRRVGVGQRLAWAVYLGDGANGVTVSGNTIAGNGNGMLLFDGHDVTVRGNDFSASSQAHIQMAETAAGRVRRNSVTQNSFSSRNGEETYRLSSDAGTASVAQFATMDANQYRSASSIFANYNGEPLGYAQWKQRTGQDGSSSYAAP